MLCHRKEGLPQICLRPSNFARNQEKCINADLHFFILSLAIIKYDHTIPHRTPRCNNDCKLNSPASATAASHSSLNCTRKCRPLIELSCHLKDDSGGFLT